MPSFNCPICAVQLPSLPKYVQHCHHHRNERNFCVPCPYDGCRKKLRSSKGLETHVYRHHRDEVFPTNGHANLDVSLVCPLPQCGEHVTGNDRLLKHLQDHLKEGRTVPCPYKDCGLTFCTLNAFRIHKTRKHKNSDISPRHEMQTSECVNETGDDYDMDSNCDIDYDDDLVSHNMALFYMRLEAKLLVPKTTIDSIVSEFSACSQISTQQRLDRVSNVVQRLELNPDARDAIMNVVSEPDPFSECNENFFSTAHKRLNFYKSNFKFVEPVTIHFGPDKYNKDSHMQYIPIKNTLSAMLDNPKVMAQCEAVPTNEKCVLKDVTDGRLCKDNDYFNRQNGPCIKILLFQDAFEVVNVLGSAKTHHKLLGVYFTLLNILPENRSKRDNMQLAILCYDKHVSEFGMNAIFRPLVEDLRDLELNGLCVNGRRLSVGLACIAGDNLGQHQLGGFQTNFSHAPYICRFCDIHRAKFTDDAAEIGRKRTPATHNRDVARSTRQETPSNGVVRGCVFNELDSFHSATPGLCPCLGHDLFEGVVKEDVWLCINYFIKVKKSFTLEQLNQQIRQFPFRGSENASAPVTISPTAKRISGQAMEVYNFVRFMPLLFGTYVSDKNDDVWLLLENLQGIVLYLMAPKISHGQVYYMDSLIKEYLELRQTLFPNNTMKPKHHYLSHYANLTFHFGPLKHSWTLRFEAKHSYFKKIANRNCNYRNISKSLAKKHQVLQAYNDHNLTEGGPVMADDELFVPSRCSTDIQLAVEQADLDFRSNPISAATKVNSRGITYTSGQYVVLRVEGEIWEKVGEIMFALQDGDCCYLLLQQFSVETLPYTHLYIRSPQKEDTLCISTDSLLDAWPLELYTINHIAYLVPKHSVVPPM